MTDDALVQLFTGGDAHAFAVLYNRHREASLVLYDRLADAYSAFVVRFLGYFENDQSRRP